MSAPIPGGKVTAVELADNDSLRIDFGCISVTLDYETAQRVALHAAVLRKARVDRAEVHARLAEVQAHRCASCPVGDRLAEVVELAPKSEYREHRDLNYSPLHTVETTGDRL